MHSFIFMALDKEFCLRFRHDIILSVQPYCDQDWLENVLAPNHAEVPHKSTTSWSFMTSSGGL